MRLPTADPSLNRREGLEDDNQYCDALRHRVARPPNPPREHAPGWLGRDGRHVLPDLHWHRDGRGGCVGESTAGTPPDSLAVALAFGLVLVALVGALGQVSGAHLNAAVTLGLAVTRKFPWRYVPSYLGFQLLGAILGAGATWAAFGSAVRNRAHLGATVPGQGVSEGRAFLVESLITFLLAFVIIAVSTDNRVSAAVAAPAIGFALIGAVLIGGGVTVAR